MTAQFRFCIAIGFFAVIGQTNSSMCYDMTSYSVRQRRISSRAGVPISIEREIFPTQFNESHYPSTHRCCSGWKGESCEEPLFCYIASEASEVPPVNNTGNVTANPNKQWKGFLRECQPECLGQINSTLFINDKIDNTNYYLIPYNSTCNTIVTRRHRTIWKMYIISGVAMLTIIVPVMVFATVYAVRRKQRTRHIMKNEPTESIYNDVSLRPMSNIYDDVLPPTPNYDDVIVPPNRVYDEVFLVPNRDYVNVQPISVYDDVNVGSNCVYDEVNVEPILDPWSRSNPQMITIKNSSRMKKS